LVNDKCANSDIKPSYRSTRKPGIYFSNDNAYQFTNGLQFSLFSAVHHASFRVKTPPLRPPPFRYPAFKTNDNATDLNIPDLYDRHWCAEL